MSAPVRHAISTEHERFWIAAQVAREGLACGLDSLRLAGLRIVVAELVSNAVRHAGGGVLTAGPIERGGRRGLEVIVEDEGPGITSITSALRDGFSRGRVLTPDLPPAARQSLGVGLGAVARLTDELLIEPRSPSGTRIMVVLWSGL